MIVVHPHYIAHFDFTDRPVVAVINGVADMSVTNGIESHDSCLRLLFLSNLLEEKGIFDAIAAARELSERGVAVRLTIVGAILEASVRRRLDEILASMMRFLLGLGARTEENDGF